MRQMRVLTILLTLTVFVFTGIMNFCGDDEVLEPLGYPTPATPPTPSKSLTDELYEGTREYKLVRVDESHHMLLRNPDASNLGSVLAPGEELFQSHTFCSSMSGAITVDEANGKAYLTSLKKTPLPLSSFIDGIGNLNLESSDIVFNIEEVDDKGQLYGTLDCVLSMNMDISGIPFAIEFTIEDSVVENPGEFSFGDLIHATFLAEKFAVTLNTTTPLEIKIDIGIYEMFGNDVDYHLAVDGAIDLTNLFGGGIELGMNVTTWGNIAISGASILDLIDDLAPLLGGLLGDDINLDELLGEDSALSVLLDNLRALQIRAQVATTEAPIDIDLTMKDDFAITLNSPGAKITAEVEDATEQKIVAEVTLNQLGMQGDDFNLGIGLLAYGSMQMPINPIGYIDIDLASEAAPLNLSVAGQGLDALTIAQTGACDPIILGLNNLKGIIKLNLDLNALSITLPSTFDVDIYAFADGAISFNGSDFTGIVDLLGQLLDFELPIDLSILDLDLAADNFALSLTGSAGNPLALDFITESYPSLELGIGLCSNKLLSIQAGLEGGAELADFSDLTNSLTFDAFTLSLNGSLHKTLVGELLADECLGGLIDGLGDLTGDKSSKSTDPLTDLVDSITDIADQTKGFNDIKSLLPEELMTILESIAIEASLGDVTTPFALGLNGSLANLEIALPFANHSELLIYDESMNDGLDINLYFGLDMNALALTYADELGIDTIDIDILLDGTGPEVSGHGEDIIIIGSALTDLLGDLLGDDTEIPADLISAISLVLEINAIGIDLLLDDTTSNLLTLNFEADDYSALHLGLNDDDIINGYLKLLNGLSLDVTNLDFSDLANLALTIDDLTVSLYGEILPLKLETIWNIISPLLGDSLSSIPEELIDLLLPLQIDGYLGKDEIGNILPLNLIVAGTIDNLNISIPDGTEAAINITEEAANQGDAFDLTLAPLKLEFNGIDISYSDSLSLNELNLMIDLEGEMAIEGSFIEMVIGLIAGDELGDLESILGLLASFGITGDLNHLRIDISTDSAFTTAVLDFGVTEDYSVLGLTLSGNPLVDIFMKLVGDISLGLADLSNLDLSFNNVGLNIYGEIYETKLGDFLPVIVPLLGDDLDISGLLALFNPITISGDLAGDPTAGETPFELLVNGDLDNIGISIPAGSEFSLDVLDSNGASDGLELSFTPLTLGFNGVDLTIADPVNISALDIGIHLEGVLNCDSTFITEIVALLGEDAIPEEMSGLLENLGLNLTLPPLDITLSSSAATMIDLDIDFSDFATLSLYYSGMEAINGGMQIVGGLSLDLANMSDIATAVALNALAVQIYGTINELSIGLILDIAMPLMGDLELPEALVDLITPVVIQGELGAVDNALIIGLGGTFDALELSVSSDDSVDGDAAVVLSLSVDDVNDVDNGATDGFYLALTPVNLSLQPLSLTISDNLTIPDLDLNLQLGGDAYVSGTNLQVIIESMASTEEEGGESATLDLSQYDLSASIPLSEIAILSEMVDNAGTMVTKLNVAIDLPLSSPGTVLNINIFDNVAAETRFNLDLYAAGDVAVTLAESTEISFPNDGSETFGLTIGLDGLVDTLNLGDVLGIIMPLLGDSLSLDIPTDVAETFDITATIPASKVTLADNAASTETPILLGLALPEAGEMSMQITDSVTLQEYLSISLTLGGEAGLAISPEFAIGFDPGLNVMLYGSLNEFPVGIVLDLLIPILGDSLPEGMDLEPLADLFDPITIEGIIAEAGKALVIKIAGPTMEDIAIELFREDDPHFTDDSTAATLPILLSFILRDSNDLTDGLRVDFNNEDLDLSDLTNAGIALEISPLDLDLGADVPFSNIGLNLTVAGGVGLDAGVLNDLLGSLLPEDMVLDLSTLKMEFILKETNLDIQAPDIENFVITLDAVGGYSELDLYLKPDETWIQALDVNAKIQGEVDLSIPSEGDFGFELKKLPSSSDDGFLLAMYGVVPGLNLGVILDMVLPLLGDSTELPIPESIFDALGPINIVGSIGNVALPFKLEIAGNLDNLSILVAEDCTINIGTTDGDTDDGLNVEMDVDYTGLKFDADGAIAALNIQIESVDIGGGETETQFKINQLHLDLIAKGTIGIGGSLISSLLDSLACDEACETCKADCAGDATCELGCGLIPIDMSVFDINLEANNLTIGLDGSQTGEVINLDVEITSPTGPSSIAIDINSISFASLFAMVDGIIGVSFSLTDSDYEMTLGIPATEEIRVTIYGAIADSMNPASLDFFINLILPLLGDDLPIPQEVFDLLTPLTLYGNLATEASPLVLSVTGSLDNLGLEIPGSPDISLTIQDANGDTDGLELELNPLSLLINGIKVTIGEELAFDTLGLQLSIQGNAYVAGSVIELVLDALTEEGEESPIPIDLGMFNIGIVIQPTEVIVQAESITVINVLISSPSALYSELYLQVDDGSGAVDLVNLYAKINGGIGIDLPSCDAACEACKTACAGDTTCEDACESEMAFGLTGLTLTLYGELQEVSFEYIFGLLLPMLGGEEELAIPQELLDLIYPMKLQGDIGTNPEPISVIVEGTLDALNIQVPPKPAITLVVTDDNMGDGFDLNMSALSLELNGIDVTIADPMTFNMLNINVILQGSIVLNGAKVEEIIAMLGEEGEESPIPIDLSPFGLSFVLNQLTLTVSTTDLTTISMFVTCPPGVWSALELSLNSVSIGTLSIQANGEIQLALPNCDAACEACKTACAGDATCEEGCGETEMTFLLNNIFVTLFGSLTSLNVEDVLDLMLPLLAGECEEGDTDCEDCITACAGDADCELNCTMDIPTELLDLFAPLSISGNLASSISPVSITVDGTFEDLSVQIPGTPSATIVINDTNGMTDDIYVALSELKLTINMIDIALDQAAEETFQINTANIQLALTGDLWIDGAVIVDVLDILACDDDCQTCKTACAGDADCELACGLLPVDLSPFRIDGSLNKLTVDLANTNGLDGFDIMITSPGTSNMGYSSLILRYNSLIMAELYAKILGAVELDLLGCDAACETCKIACAGDSTCEDACETGMGIDIPGLTVMLYGSLNAFSLETIVDMLLPLLAGECDQDCLDCQALCGGDATCEQDCALPIPSAILNMLSPLSISGTIASQLAPIMVIASGGLDNLAIQMPAGPQISMNLLDSNGMADGLEISLSLEMLFNGIDVTIGEELVISALALTLTLTSGTVGLQGSVVTTLLSALSEDGDSALPTELLQPFELVITLNNFMLDLIAAGLEDINIFVTTVSGAYSILEVNTDFDLNGSYDDAMAALFFKALGSINLGLGDSMTFGAEDLMVYIYGALSDTSLGDIINVVLPLLASDCEVGDTECEDCITACAGDADCELNCKLPIPSDIIDLVVPLEIAGNLGSSMSPLILIVDGTMDALSLAIPGDISGPKLIANLSGVHPSGYYDINLSSFELIFAGIEVEINAGEFIILDLNLGIELNGAFAVKGSFLTVILDMFMDEPLDIPIDLAMLKITATASNILILLSTTDMENIFVDIDTQSSWSTIGIQIDPELIDTWYSLVSASMQAYASIMLNIGDEFALIINNFEIWAYGSIGSFPLSAILAVVAGLLGECDQDCLDCQALCGGDPDCEAACLPMNINGLVPYFEGITISGTLAGAGNPVKVNISGNFDRLGINMVGPYDANVVVTENPTGNAPESDFDILGFNATIQIVKVSVDVVLGCDTTCENCKAACAGDADCEDACEFPIVINKIDIPIGFQGQVILIGTVLNEILGLFGDSLSLPFDLATFGIFLTLPATQMQILATGMDYISVSITEGTAYGALDLKYDDDYVGNAGDLFAGVPMIEADAKIYGALALDLGDTSNINFMFNNFTIAMYGFMHPTRLSFMMTLMGAVLPLPDAFQGLFDIMELEGYLGNAGTPITISIDGSFSDIIYVGINTLGVDPILDIDLTTPPYPLVEATAKMQGFIQIDSSSGSTEIIFDGLMLSLVGNVSLVRGQLATADIASILLELLGESLGDLSGLVGALRLGDFVNALSAVGTINDNNITSSPMQILLNGPMDTMFISLYNTDVNVNLYIYNPSGSGGRVYLIGNTVNGGNAGGCSTTPAVGNCVQLNEGALWENPVTEVDLWVTTVKVYIYYVQVDQLGLRTVGTSYPNEGLTVDLYQTLSPTTLIIDSDSPSGVRLSDPGTDVAEKVFHDIRFKIHNGSNGNPRLNVYLSTNKVSAKAAISLTLTDTVGVYGENITLTGATTGGIDSGERPHGFLTAYSASYPDQTPDYPYALYLGLELGMAVTLGVDVEITTIDIDLDFALMKQGDFSAIVGPE